MAIGRRSPVVAQSRATDLHHRLLPKARTEGIIISLQSLAVPLSLPVVAPSRVQWRQADHDLWVATLDGEFAGMLSTDDLGRHHVTDRIARPVLATGSWAVATAALDPVSDHVAPSPARRRRRRRGRNRPAGR